MKINLRIGLASSARYPGEDFICGDDRASSQPTLLSLHNIWLLHHNMVAEGINTAAGNRFDHIDPKTKDELIYQVCAGIYFVAHWCLF